jgi:replicative DNA helicase
MSDTLELHSVEYQVKVLAYMLQNPTFCQVAKEVASIESWADRALQWYYATITESKIPLSSALLREELLRAAKSKQIKESEVDKVAGYYPYIVSTVNQSEEQHIQETFGNFARRQAMKKAILESLDHIQRDEWDEVVANVEKARNTGLDILTTGHNFFADLKARIANREATDESRHLSTGISELDVLLGGGLKNTQMGLAVGGSGRGKSLFLCWLARIAVLLGHQVVYYTLELSEQDVADRFDALFAHIKIQDLRSMNDELYKQLHPLHAKYGNNLIIKGYPEGEASIHTFEAHIKQLNSIGVTPTLILIDYVDLMKSHKNYNDINQEQGAVIQACRGLAQKYNTRVWTACQFNRGGMTADTPDESGLAGSIKRFFTADICLFLAATPEERLASIIRLIIKKNRNGPPDRSVKIATDFEHMTFYSGPAIKSALETGQATTTGSDFDEEGEELQIDPSSETGVVIID